MRARALLVGAVAAVVVAFTPQPTKSHTASQSSSPSPSHTVQSPTQTPTQTPSQTGFPALVPENGVWAVINTTTGGGDAVPVPDGLLFRDPNNGELYLALQQTTDCGVATGTASYDACGLDATGVAYILGSFVSPGGVWANGYFPNVASESTSGQAVMADILTFYSYVHLVQNASTGGVAIDLWDATGAVTVNYNPAAQLYIGRCVGDADAGVRARRVSRCTPQARTRPFLPLMLRRQRRSS